MTHLPEQIKLEPADSSGSEAVKDISTVSAVLAKIVNGLNVLPV